jgi:alkylation response protein AidB-like acyl-CoA dehydrogenase
VSPAVRFGHVSSDWRVMSAMMTIERTTIDAAAQAAARLAYGSAAALDRKRSAIISAASKTPVNASA